MLCAAALSLLLSLAAPPDSAADDKKLLESVKAPTDGPGLLIYLRQRMPTEDARRKADALVEKLSSGNFRQRERASAGLIALGSVARPALFRALKNGDAEVRRRARECLDALQRTSGPEVEAAAVRLLKLRRPEGACAVLLDYLPTVREEEVEEEIIAALLVLGVRGGKVDEKLVRALAEKDPAKRAAAALVLGHSGTKAQREKVHKMLRSDAAPKVRLWAAQGLLAGRDKRAVPALLPLLTDAPPAVAEEVHDLLSWVAGDRAPPVALGEDAAARKKCLAGWEAWWKTHGNKLDLAKLNVDLPRLSLGRKARAVTIQFTNALTKGDSKALLEVIDAPFLWVGSGTMKSRQEVDAVFRAAAAGAKEGSRITFSRPCLGDLSEYLRVSADKATQEFTAAYPQRQFCLVYLTYKVEGEGYWSSAAVLVRVRGGQAKVVGLGDVRKPPRRK
jgi:HEAT repeat protein